MSAPGVCCVGTFSSAEKALEGMVAVQPDVILMDINLPGMSGIECLSRLRNDLLAAHVIMLTVYEDSERKDLRQKHLQGTACAQPAGSGGALRPQIASFVPPNLTPLPAQHIPALGDSEFPRRLLISQHASSSNSRLRRVRPLRRRIDEVESVR